MNDQDPTERESSAGGHFYGLYKDCGRKFFLKYILGFRPSKTAKPLIFGSVIHDTIKNYYLTYDRDIEETVTHFLNELLKREHDFLLEEDFTQCHLLGPAYLREWDTTWKDFDQKTYDLVEVEQIGDSLFRLVGEVGIDARRIDPEPPDLAHVVVPPVRFLPTDLVAGRLDDRLAGRLTGRCGLGGPAALWVELHDPCVDLFLDSGERQDIQHTLAMTQEVHDLLFTGTDHDRRTADHQVHPGHVLVEMRREEREDLADQFQPDPGVQ